MSLQTINGLGLSITSPARAVQQFNDLKMNLKSTNGLILQLAPDAYPILELQIAHYVAAYLIQDIVREQRYEVIVGLDRFEGALKRARYLKDNSHTTIYYGTDSIVEFDENGNPVVNEKRAKSGKGKDVRGAVKVLMDQNPMMSRKDMIAKMVDELGIKPTTASTYYSTLNKSSDRPKASKAKRITLKDKAVELFKGEIPDDRQKFVDALVDATGCSKASANTMSYQFIKSGDKKVKRTTRKSGDREATIQALYQSKKWPDRKAFVKEIVAKTGCSPASANTFSYKVMPSTRVKK